MIRQQREPVLSLRVRTENFMDSFPSLARSRAQQKAADPTFLAESASLGMKNESPIFISLNGYLEVGPDLVGGIGTPDSIV